MMHKIWLKKAEDDLRWTKSNIDSGVYYGACFTAQQTAEKALKAFLLSRKINVRKIHDISALLEECIKIDAAFESIREDILPLVDYYVQTRYPDMGDFIEYTEQKAQEAYKNATKTLKFIKSKLA